MSKNAETIKYPAESAHSPEGFKGKHVIHFDKCIGCGLCAKICPANAIKLEIKKRKIKIGKTMSEQILRKIYSIDLGRCVFCQRCEEICPTKAIELTREFDMASDKFDNLRVGKR